MNRRFRAALASAVTIAVLVGGALVAPSAIAAPSTGTIAEFDQSTAFSPVNLGTDLAAEVPAGSSGESALLRQAPRTQADNQAWYLRPAGEGVFALVSASNGLALTRVPADRGTAVGQRPANGQADQVWAVRSLGGDLGTIGVPGTDQVLEVGADAGDAGAVTLGGYRAEPTQQWLLSPMNPVLITAVPSRAAGPTGWYNDPVDVTLTAQEYMPSVPLPRVQWRTSESSDWADATSAVRVSAEGRTVLRYRALRQGSVAAQSEGFTVIQIDSVGPEVSARAIPESGSVAASGVVRAIFSATDATSGVDHIEYAVDHGMWVRGEGVELRETGVHTVDYRAVDVARNPGPTKTITLTVQAVTATATVASADRSPAGGWYQKDVAVTLVAPQAGQKIQYRLYGSDWKTYTGPVKVARNGVSTLDHRLVVGGQPVVGSQASLTVKFDKVAPSVTATRSPASGRGTPSKPVSVSFVAKDLHAGVGSVEYRVNAGEWVMASAAPVVFDKVGSYAVKYRVTDVAGNVSLTRSVPVTITAK